MVTLCWGPPLAHTATVTILVRSGGGAGRLWHDGQGVCLFRKRLERGRFLWPSLSDGVVTRPVIAVLMETPHSLDDKIAVLCAEIARRARMRTMMRAG